MLKRILDAKKEQNDNSKLENLSLKDQVNFSTLTLQIYKKRICQTGNDC